MKPIFLAALVSLAVAVPAGAQAFERSATVTGGNGRGFTRETSGTYDRATRSFSSPDTVTTNGGATATRNVARGCAPTETGGSCSGSATVTGPRGGTTTTDVARSFGGGTGSATATRTGPNGRSVTGERWITVTP